VTTLRVLAVPALWSDETGVPGWLPELSRMTARAALWYRIGSYGKTELVFDVGSPGMIDSPIASTASAATFNALAMRMHAMGYDLGRYDRLVYFTSRNQTVGFKGLNWGVGSWVNCMGSDYAPFSFIHELGHSLGLAHPRTVTVGTWAARTLTLPPLPVTVGGMKQDLYDKSTSMGFEATFTEFAAYQKAAIPAQYGGPWIVPATYDGGDRTFTLTPLREPGGVCYAVRVPMAQFFASSRRVYWLEYRTDTGGEDGVQLRLESDFGAGHVPSHVNPGPGFQPGDRITDGTLVVDVVAPGVVKLRKTASSSK
jgi:hypothetical protein